MENIGEGTEEARLNVVESLISSMNEQLAALANEIYTVCIFRVPEIYRRVKEEDYTPRVISIGPLHYGDSTLQAMEAYKLRYLHDFLIKFGVGIDKLVSIASNMEVLVRACYEDTTKIKSKEFCRMILLDGVFIVQLFIKNLIDMREPGDMLFENRWMASDLMHDMLLLENQLPIFFILVIFDLVDPSRVHQKSFHQIAFEYFITVGNLRRLELTPHCQQSRHLVEFLFNLHRPSNIQVVLPETSFTGRFRHIRSATELHEAGVCFVKGSGKLFEVSFEAGRLTIPSLIVDDKTETFFRNLIAFEKCGHHVKYITSYIIFMYNLIETDEDMKLLLDYGIINNMLGEDHQLVADLFTNVGKEIRVDPGYRDFIFAKTCYDLCRYNKGPIHMLKSKLYRSKLILETDYFGEPWAFFKFIVICFTIIQTVCALLGLALEQRRSNS
ncbi:UPF0481 protein At3g47200-like [Apium graveolens]|uniref:UPF0481 protein At3g47200-like n=1 Tax=Apium graveolens TaxID=4045 RepID=UPI003D7B555C